MQNILVGKSTNTKLREKNKSGKVEITIKRQKWKQVRHTLKKLQNNLTKQVLKLNAEKIGRLART